MRLVVELAFLCAVVFLLWVGVSAVIGQRRRVGPWRVETITRPDGALAVILLREGSEHGRTVRELPADMDSVELTSELRLAREDAQLQADELNRSA